MKRESLVKQALLLILWIEALFTYLGMIPQIGLLITIIVVSIVYLVRIANSLRLSEEKKKVRKKVFLAFLTTILWYEIAPYLFVLYMKIPINETLWIAFVFGTIAFVALMLSIRDSSDIDRSGNIKWQYISRGKYMCTLAATISFTIAILFCIEVYRERFLSILPILVYVSLGICTVKRI